MKAIASGFKSFGNKLFSGQIRHFGGGYDALPGAEAIHFGGLGGIFANDITTADKTAYVQQYLAAADDKNVKSFISDTTVSKNEKESVIKDNANHLNPEVAKKIISSMDYVDKLSPAAQRVYLNGLKTSTPSDITDYVHECLAQQDERGRQSFFDDTTVTAAEKRQILEDNKEQFITAPDLFRILTIAVNKAEKETPKPISVNDIIEMRQHALAKESASATPKPISVIDIIKMRQDALAQENANIPQSKVGKVNDGSLSSRIVAYENHPQEKGRG